MVGLLDLPPEILLEIFSLLEGSPEILNFGLTCRKTWKLAEALLWRDNADHHIIWGLLPDNVLDSNWSIRDLSPTEWQPLLHYGALIRQLHFDDSRTVFPDSGRSSPSLFESDSDGQRYFSIFEQVVRVLRSYSDRSVPFFPQLQSLELLISLPTSIGWIPHLLKPSLTELEIRLESMHDFPNADVLHLIRAIQPCVELESLVLASTNRSQNHLVDSSLSSLLGQLSKLRNLHLYMNVNGDTIFPSLATRPLLDNLVLDPRTLDLSPFPQVFHDAISSESTPGFPSLRIFSFVYNQLSIAHAPLSLLATVASRKLEWVEIHCNDIEDLRDVSKLAGNEWSAKLKVILLHMDGLERVWYPGDPFFEAISPLRQCSGLRTFKIRSEKMALPLDDKHYERMACAWPDLEEFVVDDRGVRQESALASCVALLHLASRCPRLRRLRICVDFDRPPLVTSLTPWDITSNVRMLHLTYSTGSQPHDIGNFLLATFPCLIAFDYHAREKGMAPVGIQLGLPGCSDSWQVYTN